MASAWNELRRIFTEVTIKEDGIMRWENTVLEHLVGKKLLEVRVGDECILFECETEIGDRTRLVLCCEGDCCSQSWMSDLYNFSSIIGQTVTHIEEPEVIHTDINDGRGRQSDDEAYGYLICSDKGKAELVFRNSSNGYYGGWLSIWSNYKDDLLDTLTVVEDNWKNA